MLYTLIIVNWDQSEVLILLWAMALKHKFTIGEALIVILVFPKDEYLHKHKEQGYLLEDKVQTKLNIFRWHKRL